MFHKSITRSICARALSLSMIVATALFFTLESSAQRLPSQPTSGGELDNESRVIAEARKAHGAELPQAVIVRVKAAPTEINQKVEVLHSFDTLSMTDSANFVKAHVNDFTAVTPLQLRGELDQTSSTSSWYFYFGAYSYYYGYPYTPSYYYYGNSYWYHPCGYSSWGGYNYYYYGNPYYGW